MAMAQTISKYEAERILELSGTYDKRILKKAYVTKVRTCHPDVAQAHGLDPDEAERITKKVNEAFVVLSGLFNESVTSVTCDTEPSHASASSTTSGSSRASASSATSGASRASRASHASSTSGTSAAGASRRTSAAHEAREAWEAHKAARETGDKGTGSRTASATGAATASYATSADKTRAATTEPPRGDPRNMEAARRYTKIVTSPFYIALYTNKLVSGAVFVAGMCLVGLVFGLIFASVMGTGMVSGAVTLAFVAGVIGAVTGSGSSVVEAFADVHAVNKATRGL